MKRWIAIGLTIAASINLWAQAPEMFRYQGRLVNGTNLVNATVPMSFKLYNALSGGTRLYEDSNSVLVVDGLYSTYIGDNTVFGSLTNAMTNAAVYLELTVNGETLSPRERLVSVPYALNTGGNTPVHERIIGLSGTLNFGNVYTGLTKTVTLTIQNDGYSLMTVTGLQYSDARFSGNWSGKLLPYSSTNLLVTFAPVLGQVYSGTITVNCDRTSGTNTIVCTGTGKAVRYIDNGDGTVTDYATGLMWTKNANHGPMNGYDAVTYCDNLVASGYSDWRLPTVGLSGYGGKAELDTLFRASGNPDGAWEGSAGTPFTGVQDNKYWSGTLRPTSSSAAVLVNMGSGIMYDYFRDNVYYVWPVRGGQ